MTRNSQVRKPVQSAVQMAVAALDNHPSRSPLDDPDMRYVDPSPGSLDLPLPGAPGKRRTSGTGSVRGRIRGQSLRRRECPAALR